MAESSAAVPGRPKAEDLLAIDPLNEAAYRFVMRASAVLGNRAAVVRAMERCQTLLHNHVGVEPSPETSELYADLTRGIRHKR